MGKSRPSPLGLAEFAEAVITGSETIFGANLNGCAEVATRNQKGQKMSNPINKYSLKKIAELNAETSIRRALCYRAYGIPIEYVEVVYRKGIKHTINRVRCQNGVCECGCGEFSPVLKPHELVSRAYGGKLSMTNSIMVKDNHHAILQNNLPKWA